MGFVALGIIIVFSTLLILFGGYLDSSVNEMLGIIDTLNEYVENKDYENADYCYQQLKTKWDKSEYIYGIQIENDELDYINELMAEMDSYFERNYYEDYFETSYKLIFYLNHLAVKNKVSTDTIL